MDEINIDVHNNDEILQSQAVWIPTLENILPYSCDQSAGPVPGPGALLGLVKTGMQYDYLTTAPHYT